MTALGQFEATILRLIITFFCRVVCAENSSELMIKY